MKRTVLTCLVALCAAFFAAGCKNVCQKAGEHYIECWQQYCEQHSDDTRCEIALDNSMAQAMTEADSCPMEERATAIVNATCEELTAEGGPGL